MIGREKWMTPATEKMAERKLENMLIQVGHGRGKVRP
jgi:predicted metalloendopeptidase